MKLKQANRLYNTWKNHPDMWIQADQAACVVETYIRLSKKMKKMYEQMKEEKNDNK